MDTTGWIRAGACSDRVAQIVESIDAIDQALSQFMINRFFWHIVAYDNPDMTAEEIASAAADGFAVEV